MADLTRWEPLRDLVSLREAMDRLFEESFVRVPGLRKGETIFSPEVDMYETDKEVVVKATVPGIKPEDMEITATGDRLVIKGKLEEEKKEEGTTYVIQERRFGEFERVLPLPPTADVDKAEAEFKDGVLTVKIPKIPEVPSKKIQIKGGKK